MKLMKFYIVVIVCLIAFAGCASEIQSGNNDDSNNQTVYKDSEVEGVNLSKTDDSDNQTVYEYKDSEVGGVNLSKTVYEDNQVTLFLKDADYFTDFRDFKCFDKTFNVIDCEWDVKLEKNKLIIKGDKANKISGIKICDGYNSEMLELRYLDSAQFAQLTSSFADDLGWETSGDEEAFYTKEELEAIEERKEAIQKKNDEIYNLFEGIYVCEDNPDLYIEIYNSDTGRRIFMKTINYIGEEEQISISIEQADIRDTYGSYDGPVVIFTESDVLEYEVELRYSDDYNTLWQYDDGPVFTRVRHK